MESKARRASQWKHPLGVEQTKVTMRKLFEPFVAGFVDNGLLATYSTYDMKAGINTAKLREHVKFLEAGLRIDPRGGIFNQIHIEHGFRHAVKEHDKTFSTEMVGDGPQTLKLTEKIANQATASDNDEEALLAKFGYLIRVMFSHTRIKFDGRNTDGRLKDGDEDGGLDGCFRIMATRCMPQQRPRSQHPFLFFQKLDEEDGENEDDDDDMDEPRFSLEKFKLELLSTPANPEKVEPEGPAMDTAKVEPAMHTAKVEPEMGTAKVEPETSEADTGNTKMEPEMDT